VSPLREAVVLPAVFLTVALLGGLEPGAARPWIPASPFSLVLGFLLIGVLARSGALAPERLLDTARPPLANANGLVVLLALFAASAQVLHMMTPRSGLPALIVALLLFLLLVNTWVILPERRRALRSVAVTLASAFVLKFVLLAALAEAEGGRTRRVLVALFDLATLGTISQDPVAPAAGYLAFAVALLYLAGLAGLPARHDAAAPGLVRGHDSHANVIVRPPDGR
jgi:hypothetical protein